MLTCVALSHAAYSKPQNLLNGKGEVKFSGPLRTSKVEVCLWGAGMHQPAHLTISSVTAVVLRGGCRPRLQPTLRHYARPDRRRHDAPRGPGDSDRAGP